MQQKFDWTRAEQLGLLSRASIPKRPGVSSAALKAVLKAIDDFGRGREAWPSEKSLALSSGLSLRSVKRAIKALGDLSLLVVQRRGPHTLNHYRIVWSELALLTVERSATVSERSATVSERSATVSTTKCHGGPLNVNETQRETTTTDPVVVVLSDLGLVAPQRALDGAAELGLTAEDISERIEAFKAMPAAERTPGILFNWLVRRNSYTPAGPRQLTLRRGVPPEVERERAALIAYGRGRGWSIDQLQMAVRRFESEKLEPLAEGV